MNKVGLVGTGRWAETIARTISSMDDTDIVAVYQRTRKEVPWLPEECVVYDNLSDMLRKTALTHVITAIDPRGHFEIVEKAAKYGLPVWLEKPMALSYTDVEKIFALDGSIFVDYIHLHSECFQWLCNEIKNEKPIIIRSTLYSYSPYHKFPMLYDFASHDLSMLLTTFNDIKIKNVHLTESKNGDHYSIEMQTDSCDIFTRIGNDGRAKMRAFEIDIGQDTYLYDGLKQTISKDGVEVFAAKELPLKHALRAFLSGERANKEMNLKIARLLEEIDSRAQRSR
jgi:predicted dehydrogenase